MRLTVIRSTREKLNIAAKTLRIKEPGNISIRPTTDYAQIPSQA